jgi:glycosyltransferase involved in cell wall biosynthesis
VTASVSVIIPIHNGANGVGELLLSLSQQTMPDFELVVVNNASTDNSREVVEAWADRFASLIVVDANEHKCPGFARRAGSAVASGDLLLYIDCDDTVNKEYVESLVAGLSQHVVVHAQMDMHRHNPAWIVQRDAGTGLGAVSVGGWEFVYGGTIGVRAAEYDISGGWPPGELLSEDADVCWRLRRDGHLLHCVPEAVVYRRARSVPRDMWRQGRWYGRTHSRTNRMWRPEGLPVESEWSLIGRMVRLLRTSTVLRNPHERGFWLKEAGTVTSRAQQNVKNHLPGHKVPTVAGQLRPSVDPELARYRAMRQAPVPRSTRS